MNDWLTSARKYANGHEDDLCRSGKAEIVTSDGYLNAQGSNLPLSRRFVVEAGEERWMQLPEAGTEASQESG